MARTKGNAKVPGLFSMKRKKPTGTNKEKLTNKRPATGRVMGSWNQRVIPSELLGESPEQIKDESVFNMPESESDDDVEGEANKREVTGTKSCPARLDDMAGESDSDDTDPLTQDPSVATGKVYKSKKVLKPEKCTPRKKSITKLHALKPVKKAAKKAARIPPTTPSNEDNSDKEESSENDMESVEISPGFKRCGASFVEFQNEIDTASKNVANGIPADFDSLVRCIDKIVDKVKQSKIAADKKNAKMALAAEMAQVALGELILVSELANTDGDAKIVKEVPKTNSDGEASVTKTVETVVDTPEESSTKAEVSVSADTEMSVEAGVTTKADGATEVSTETKISTEAEVSVDTTEESSTEADLSIEAEVSVPADVATEAGDSTETTVSTEAEVSVEADVFSADVATEAGDSTETTVSTEAEVSVDTSSV